MNPADIALLERLPPALRTANGVPDQTRVVDLERAVAIARHAFVDVLLPDGVKTSPLGPGWSRDVDLHLHALPDEHRLHAMGWLPLEGLMGRLGMGGRGQWAVTERHRVLACADLQVTPPPDPVEAVLARCVRRREVRLREVLELRHLLRAGHALPVGHPALAVAADVEAGLGGEALARWSTGTKRPAPAPLAGGGVRRRLSPARQLLRPRFVVAVSAVDGAGKSTVCRLVAASLERAGVPATVVWTRPGMRMEWLERPVRIVKRWLGQGARPAVEAIAAGQDVADVASRRGVLGWAWSFVVTSSFVVEVVCRQLCGRGVILYDRHLPDALVTLDFVYGSVPLTAQRWLVRRALPRPTLHFYLDVPPDVAVARKPGDVFGYHAVTSQLDGYRRWLEEESPGVEVLDGSLPPDQVAWQVLWALTMTGRADPPRSPAVGRGPS
ncbi:MAG: hypothetical protein M3N33_01570 [Actinomycetota bacterium]|nr:hypothetical protein [Actinomycetota bacterium]